MPTYFITWYKDDFDYLCYDSVFKTALYMRTRFLLEAFDNSLEAVVRGTPLSLDYIISQLTDYEEPISLLFVVILSILFGVNSSYFTEGFEMNFIGEEEAEIEEEEEDDYPAREIGDWDDL